MQTARVTPTISGEFITQHARNQVLKGHWQGALKMLVEDLEGMTYDLAFEILKGHKRIADTPEGMAVALESTEAGQTYRDELVRAFENLLLIDGRLYQPTLIIRHLCTLDAEYAVENGHDRTDTLARADFYAEGDQTAFLLDYQGEPLPIIFEPVVGVPMWVTGLTSAQKALDAHLDKGLRLLDPTNPPKTDVPGQGNPGAPEPELTLSIEPEELGQRVRDKAESQGGFMTLEVPGYRTLSVPKNAFYRWALTRTPAYDLGLVPEWDAMAPKGYKTGSDSPVHTDWWLGAGLTLDDYTLRDAPGSEEWKEALSQAVALKERDVQREVLGFEAVFLGAIKDCRGTVRHLQPGEELQKGEVGIIDRAGPEYEVCMRSAIRAGTGLICLSGGPLVHLAVVAREANAILVLWPEAKALRSGTGVVIDSTKRQVRVG